MQRDDPKFKAFKSGMEMLARCGDITPEKSRIIILEVEELPQETFDILWNFIQTR